MKHIINLTEEEKAWQAAVNRDDVRPVTPAERARLKQIAQNT